MGNAAARAAAFLTTVVLARVLSAESFALVLVAQAATQYLSIAVDFGLTLAGIREVARRPEAIRQVVGSVLAVRTPLVVVGVIVIALCAAVAGANAEALNVVVLFALATGVAALDISWVGQALQAPLLRALVVGGGALLGFALLLPALAVTRMPAVVPLTQLLGTSVVIAGAGVLVVRRYGAPGKPSARVARSVLSVSAPLALASMLAQVYYNVDLLLLGAWRTPIEVGAYGSAAKVVLALMMVSWTIAVAALPRLTLAAGVGRANLAAELGETLHLVTALALPAAVGGSLLATPIVVSLFGARYAGAAVPFVILLWTVPIAAYRIALLYSFTATGRPWAVPIASGPGAVVNVLLNVILIPAFGMVGAAIATIVAETTVAGVATWQQRGLLAEMGPRLSLSGVVSVAAMAGVLVALASQPIIVSISAGGVTWLATALASGYIPARPLASALGRLRIGRGLR